MFERPRQNPLNAEIQNQIAFEARRQRMAYVLQNALNQNEEDLKNFSISKHEAKDDVE